MESKDSKSKRNSFLLFFAPALLIIGFVAFFLLDIEDRTIDSDIPIASSEFKRTLPGGLVFLSRGLNCKECKPHFYYNFQNNKSRPTTATEISNAQNKLRQLYSFMLEIDGLKIVTKSEKYGLLSPNIKYTLCNIQARFKMV